MKDFQAANVDAIRSDRVICVIKVGNLRFKAFPVFFGKDRSLFINFPYFKHRVGILSSSVIPADGAQETQVNLEQGGKVTSHLVKYSHHPDGRAHFSQDGKIVTAIKRRSNRSPYPMPPIRSKMSVQRQSEPSLILWSIIQNP